MNVDALSINPVAKIIAKAAQTYGFVVWDKAGSISLRFENPKVFTLNGQPNPYPAIWNGTSLSPASSRRHFPGSTGLVRWTSKPAALERRRSSRCP